MDGVIKSNKLAHTQPCLPISMALFHITYETVKKHTAHVLVKTRRKNIREDRFLHWQKNLEHV